MACPKCGYARKATDTAPEWQCPACHIALDKFREAGARSRTAVATPAPGAGDLRPRLEWRLASALPDFALAALFLWCWISPTAWRPTLAAELGLLMLMEFFAIHSALLLISARGAAAAPVLLLFYAPVAGAFAYFHGGWWPVLGFAMLLAGRVLSALGSRSPDAFEAKRQRFHWANGGGAYVLFGFLALMLVPLPEIGFRRPGYVWQKWWASGVRPHEVIAWGFLYFAALGAMRLLEKPEWIERHE